GCGNFGILASVQRSIVDLDIDPKDLVIVSGIGCSGKFPHYMKTYGFESIHGRALPVAQGVRLANPELTVIAVGGDGDGYGIGSAHFLHTARRNIDMTYIVHDNRIYALTKAQYSPTTEKGHKTPTSPHGAIEVPLNPLAVAVSAGATFVARVFANDIKNSVEVIKKAISHKGFALVEIMQPCPSWRKKHTNQWFKERLYPAEGFDNRNKAEALSFLVNTEKEEKIATGIFYVENRPTYEDELKLGEKKPVVHQAIEDIDISPLLDALE
ncbi:MAG: 2-oxoacid:ferredoxin oxidoreductase subunit beta, partial [Candidatus Nanoarchaeia archaeon]